MKIKLIFVFTFFISSLLYSQEEFYQSTKKEIYDSASSLSISFSDKSGESSVFFIIDLIVENPELDPCIEIETNKNINKSILEVISSFNLFEAIYVEGENGVTEIRTGKITNLDSHALQIYIYYGAKKTMGTAYLTIKDKESAKKFISKLTEKIGYKSCFRKLKRKIT